MPDHRSVMKEYRYLDQKRVAEGLTPDEEARLSHLRDLIGPELGAGGLKPGFDVNAAAAALRESLLPAGLRNRPPPTPAAPLPAVQVPEPEPEPAEPVPDMAQALASVYEQAPFAPLDARGAGPSADALFDPSTLGIEQPEFDPNAYAAEPAAWSADPNAYQADPNAAYPADSAADPNAQPAWDPNQPWDPNAAEGAQTYDPNAYAADPNAYAADPNAYPADPNAYPADPNAAYPADAPYDPSAQPAWDPNQPWEPSAPGAPAYDPSAYAGDPNAAYPADPAAAPAWGAEAGGELPPAEAAAYPADPTSAYADAAYSAGEAPAWDAGAPEAAPGWGQPEAAEAVDPGAALELQGVQAFEEVPPEPGVPEMPEGGSFTPGEAEAPTGWDPEPAALEPAADAAFGEYDAGGAPVASAFPGEASPLEAAADLPATETAAAEAAPELGEYDDTAGFSAPSFDVSSVPADAPLDPDLAAEEPLPELGGEPPALDTSWQPEQALEGGFELASGGSFGAGADAAAPEWAQASAPPPWQDAPPLELGAPAGEAAEDAGYEVAPPPATDHYAPPASGGADLFGAPEGDLAPEDDAAALGEPAPGASELDYSQPDFSGGEEAPPDPEPGIAPGDAGDALAELPPEEAAAAPGPAIELGYEPPAGAPEVELALSDVPAEPTAPAEESPLDLSFDVSEEPAVAIAPPPPSAAPEAAVADEDDIPTIDGDDILEEIIEDVPATPLLELEPPAPPPAPAVAAPPPPPPAAAIAPPPPAEPPAGVAAFRVPGSHRVVVHTIEGLVKRGVLDDPDLEASALSLAAQPGAPGELIAAEKVKAIFFMLSPGEQAPPPEGKKVRVTFRDGRQIAGFSPDYREDGIGFFMIPADTRTNTGRIWVFLAAVRQVSVT